MLFVWDIPIASVPPFWTLSSEERQVEEMIGRNRGTISDNVENFDSFLHFNKILRIHSLISVDFSESMQFAFNYP
ncbi:hypothetical protein QQP08_011040 [Theobroma cacao]|nr:hypothetical protein QQP08_011040 [Theobroma cacao]